MCWWVVVKKKVMKKNIKIQCLRWEKKWQFFESLNLVEFLNKKKSEKKKEIRRNFGIFSWNKLTWEKARYRSLTLLFGLIYFYAHMVSVIFSHLINKNKIQKNNNKSKRIRKIFILMSMMIIMRCFQLSFIHFHNDFTVNIVRGLNHKVRK